MQKEITSQSIKDPQKTQPANIHTFVCACWYLNKMLYVYMPPPPSYICANMYENKGTVEFAYILYFIKINSK